ncbi:MAG: SIMPL domain-containing protein [Bacteroidota bacterium]
MKNQVVSALGMILAAAVFGLFFYSSRGPEQAVRVVGAATQRFESDILKWRLTISRSVGPGEVPRGYGMVASDCALVRSVLQTRGVGAKEISLQPVNVVPAYAREGQLSGYSVQQSLVVVSRNVAALEELALNPAPLAAGGLVLQYANLEYYYSRLGELKNTLLAEATRDALRRARHIASSAGMEVGSLQSARAGVFQITEPFSTEVSDYGVYNTASRSKDITVTVNASFLLR